MIKEKALEDLKSAIEAMQKAARSMQAVHDQAYFEHGREMEGAAAMATEWAQEIKKQIQQELKQ